MAVHHNWVRLLLAAGLASVVGFGVVADDQPEKPEAKAKRNPAVNQLIQKKLAEQDETSQPTPEEEAKAAEEAQARYKVPEGDAKELLKFIQENIKFRPRTAQQAVLHRKFGLPALRTAIEKLQASATEEDKKLEGYSDAIAHLLLLRTIGVAEATEEELKKLVTDVRDAVLKNENPSQQAVMAAQILCRNIETTQGELAVELNREIGATLARSKDPAIAKAGASMEGTARRLTLPGSTMEINGALTGGEKFDWAKYRGKVVLVDYWATWCGPCRAELPNVKKNFEAYHDKGFDVVGISLDNDRAKLDEFLEKEELPWACIYDGGGWQTPMATFYGINSIPRAILVDKEGKVVSMMARGPELGRLLAELLGPAEEKEADTKTSDETK